MVFDCVETRPKSELVIIMALYKPPHMLCSRLLLTTSRFFNSPAENSLFSNSEPGRKVLIQSTHCTVPRLRIRSTPKKDRTVGCTD